MKNTHKVNVGSLSIKEALEKIQRLKQPTEIKRSIEIKDATNCQTK